MHRKLTRKTLGIQRWLYGAHPPLDRPRRYGPRVMYGLRNPDGRLWLVVDTEGVPMLLEQWDLGDSQLVRRDGAYEPWEPVGSYELRALRRIAERERQRRQLRLVEDQE